jgi:hypothetical protein
LGKGNQQEGRGHKEKVMGCEYEYDLRRGRGRRKSNRWGEYF